MNVEPEANAPDQLFQKTILARFVFSKKNDLFRTTSATKDSLSFSSKNHQRQEKTCLNSELLISKSGQIGNFLLSC